MRLEGQIVIGTRRERVWAALLDPTQIAECIPARPDVEILDPTHFRTRVPVGTGMFRMTAVVDVALTTVVVPSHLEATANGSAPGGAAAAAAAIDLDEVTPESSRIRWAAEVSLGGMLAGFAAMIEGPAKSGVDDTLACLKSKLEAEVAAEAETAGGHPD